LEADSGTVSIAAHSHSRSTNAEDRISVSALSVGRRMAAAVAAVSASASFLFASTANRTYPLLTWMPVGVAFLLAAAEFSRGSRRFSPPLSQFWSSVALVALISGTSALGFSILSFWQGTLSSLSLQGEGLPGSWVIGLAVNSALTTALMLFAMLQRARAFYAGGRRSRTAVLDVIALTGAIGAAGAMLGIPSSAGIDLASLALLLPVVPWTAAAAGSLLNLIQGHPTLGRSTRLIFVGSVCMTVANAFLSYQLVAAWNGTRVSGSALGAIPIALGAMAFGEAFVTEAGQLGWAGASRNEPPLAAARPFPAVLNRVALLAGPPLLAAVVVMVLQHVQALGPLQRLAIYGGLGVALGGATTRGLLIRLEEAEAREALSSQLRGEKTFVDEILRAVDQDRAAVATRLHDHLVQPMTAAYLKLSHAYVALERGATDDALRLLSDGAKALSHQIAEARSLVTMLYPPALEHLGIDAALKQLVDAYRRQGVKIEANWDWAGRVDKAVALGIYRIANEALQNVASHADPKVCRFRLSAEEDNLVLEVEDRGPGFTQRSEIEYLKAGHIGIATMRRVAEMLGGTLAIDGAERTYVRLTIPSCQETRIGYPRASAE
jgi:signal transduction histidine kinase